MSFGTKLEGDTTILNAQQVILHYLGKTFWFQDNNAKIKTIRWVARKIDLEHITNREECFKEIRFCHEVLKKKRYNYWDTMRIYV